MPDSKISGLAGVTAFTTTQEYGVNDAGVSHKINGGQIISAVAQGTGQYGAAAYAQVTANQGTFTALTDLTSLTVTVTVGTGRRIKVTGKVGLSSSIAADQVQLFIREGATTLQTCNLSVPLNATDYTAIAIVVLTPTVGAHTYKLSAQRGGGTGNITMDAAATNPAFILVEDMGT